MTKRLGFHVFLWGTVSSAVLFLWLTWDTQLQVATLSHADRLSDGVVAGKKAFEKYNCNDCHTILGFGGYYAPDLTRVVRRVGEEGFRYRVKSPAEAFARSARKMPQLRVADAETEDMLSFFRWVGEIDNGDWPPQDSRTRLTRAEQVTAVGALVPTGAAVFQTRGCMGCHSLHGKGGTFGPALDTIGKSLTKEEIERYVRNPKGVNPNARMPAQTELSDREREEVAEFLSGLQ